MIPVMHATATEEAHLIGSCPQNSSPLCLLTFQPDVFRAMMMKAHLHDHIHEERMPGIGVSMVIAVVIFVWKRETMKQW